MDFCSCNFSLYAGLCNRYICVACQKPEIGDIVQVRIAFSVITFKVINTPKGKQLVVEGKNNNFVLGGIYLEILSFKLLTNLAGISIVVYLIVQYTKNMIPKKIPTDIYAFIVGSVTIFLTQISQEILVSEWTQYLPTLFNGFLAAITAGKIHDMAYKSKNTIKNDS